MDCPHQEKFEAFYAYFFGSCAIKRIVLVLFLCLSMSLGELNQMVSIPIAELLTRVLVQMKETAHSAKDVLIEKESFAQLSSYLTRVSPVLAELQSNGVKDTPIFRISLECLGRELMNAKDLVHTCQTKSKFYLFINCRSVVKKMQQITNEIGRALSLLPLAQLELSIDTKEKTDLLLQEMQNAEFKITHVAEEVAGKIELGLKDQMQSSNFSNDLLMQIAEAVDVDLSPSFLKTELEQLKKDKQIAELKKDKAEALHLDQIASLLSWADAACSLKEREKQYQDKRVPLGSHPFAALQSFYCPITQDVMEDPVEIASGQVFERAAIQKWFADGHTVCPTSSVELENLELRPNAILRRSINEWRERNTMIQLTAMRTKLASENDEVVLATLEELCGLCEVKSIYRHWIAAEGLVPILANLLKSSKSSIRKKTLSTLTMVVKGNLDLKDRACDVGVVPLSVRSLAREVSESRQAVSLLLELSKERKLCKQLSKVQGCILLLVTMTNCEIQQAAEDAGAVLENLAKIKEQNVVLMAEASYFRPLVQHLNEGKDMTQILMANAVSQMELTDKSRRVLVQMGVLPPLLEMLSEGNLELKSSALGALQNLSKLSENRDVMVKAGVVKLILELLFTSKSVLMTIKEQAALVFANLALATTSASCGCTTDLLGIDPERKFTIYQLLSLLNLSGPSIQSQLLRALFGISCPPSAQGLRKTIREAGAVELLLGLYQVNANTDVRLNALRLLHLLTQDGDGDALAKEMGVEVIQSLVRLCVDSPEEDVKSIVMGLFQNIPVDNISITDMLLEAQFIPVITTILQNAASNMPIKKELLENAAGVLLRFTLASNLPLQQLVAELGVIPMLLQLLKSGTPLTKCRAAMCLGQLSESTLKQTCHMKKAGRFWCIAPQVEEACRVHGGVCTIEKSFCLLEAQAVPLLLQALEEQEPAVVESALGALATLLYDEFWDRGADAIAEASGVGPIIKLLTIGNTRVQETALWILERIFRKERYRARYGSRAQMPLISLTQDGANKTRHQAARILAHLNVLQEQSSYF
eukprot:c18275_g1_i1 orf=636-3776(-)